MMHKRTKACDIPQSVKEKVWERDCHKCVVCGSYNAFPNAHILSRAKGGKGVETNIVTLCGYAGNDCHRRYDNGTKEEHEMIDNIIARYMKGIYGDGWCKEDQRWNKYE